MAHSIAHPFRPTAPHGVPPSLFARALSALAIRRERRSLLDLDDHLLGDIGLTRDEARIESARDVWDVPANWTRR
jgi:uncharacterized protein YjiS (DUF1127 family)